MEAEFSSGARVNFHCVTQRHAVPVAAVRCLPEPEGPASVHGGGKPVVLTNGSEIRTLGQLICDSKKRFVYTGSLFYVKAIFCHFLPLLRR
jgi:hypothetical protein